MLPFLSMNYRFKPGSGYFYFMRRTEFGSENTVYVGKKQKKQPLGGAVTHCALTVEAPRFGGTCHAADAAGRENHPPDFIFA